MTQPDRNAVLKKRFFDLFVAMATKHGIPYASGYLIGWLSYLARHDYTIMTKLSYLEKLYKIDDDGRS